MDNQELQIFKFFKFNLQTIVDEDGIWFIAAPLAEFLGYSTPSRAIRVRVDKKNVKLVYVPQKNNNFVCVNESGLYELVLRSDRPEAKEFQRWVTHEVLPNIRKYGFHIDYENVLTPLSKAEIDQNLDIQLNTVRAVLPKSTLSPLGVLIAGAEGSRTNPDGWEPENYCKALDKLNLPGIVVHAKTKTDPIRIVFDWYNRHKHDKNRVKALYNRLGEVCAGKKCMSGGQPFEHAGNLEEIFGFKSTDEAEALAEKLRTITLETLPIVA